MRVVCDNCGAVYKISSAKLVKKVNRATCKRCGHKILISKAGDKSADEADTGAQHGAGESEQVVVRSSPELGSAPLPSVPSIGSLTAELRAITIPGIDGVGGKKSTGAARLGPDPADPDGELTERRDIARLPTAPSGGIPASDSPVTMAYGGPSPSVPAEGPTALAPTSEPVTGPAATFAASGMVSARNVPSPQEDVAKQKVRPTPSRTVAGGGGAVVLKAVFICAAVGVLGMVATEFLTGAAAIVATTVSSIGLFGSFLLAALTDTGARPERIPLALILGLVCGVVLSIPSVLELDSSTSLPVTQTRAPTVSEQPVDTEAPTGSPLVGEESAEAAAGDAARSEALPSADGLSQEELEEARRFDAAAGTTPAASPKSVETASSEPTPAKGSKADIDPVAEAKQAAAAAARAEEKRAAAAERRENRRREEAARREEADNRAAERQAEEKRSTGLGGPKRASLKKPESSQPSSSSSSGPKPFVIDTIIRNNGNIKRCLEAEAARGQDLSGKIFLQFTISPDGGVGRAKLTTSRWAGTSLDTCISKQVNRLEFPPFEGKAKKIKYALVIQ